MTTRSRIKITIVLLASTLATAWINCQAYPFYLGVLAGYSSNDYNHIQLKNNYTHKVGRDAGFTPMPIIGYQFTPNLGLELSIIYSPHVNLTEITSATGTVDINKSNLLNNLTSLAATYSHSIPFIKSLQAQAGLGIGFTGRTGINYLNQKLLKEGIFFRTVFSLGFKIMLPYHLIGALRWQYAIKNSDQQLPATVFYGAGIIYQFT